MRGVDQGHYHDDDDDDDDELGREETETAQMPSFLNFSLTPIECSIMCPWHLAEAYIAPLIEGLKASTQSQSQSQTPDLTELSISWDDYLAMQVIGTGVGAGQRVLDLTSPLAMAGMYVLPWIPGEEEEG